MRVLQVTEPARMERVMALVGIDGGEDGGDGGMGGGGGAAGGAGGVSQERGVRRGSSREGSESGDSAVEGEK